jgi:alkanesulfonate monooxygenase SsuD/methylene tetrahydromethanopterin reductase-like flavin-dependent oxidoreductase (luciferase family)
MVEGATTLWAANVLPFPLDERLRAATAGAAAVRTWAAGRATRSAPFRSAHDGPRQGARDSEDEARAHFELVHKERGDVSAARNVLRMNMPNSQSADWDSLPMQRIVAGFRALPLVGTPDQVAARMIDLHAADVDGLALSWPDVDEGLRQLQEQTLPRLEIVRAS